MASISGVTRPPMCTEHDRRGVGRQCGFHGLRRQGEGAPGRRRRSARARRRGGRPPRWRRTCWPARPPRDRRAAAPAPRSRWRSCRCSRRRRTGVWWRAAKAVSSSAPTRAEGERAGLQGTVDQLQDAGPVGVVEHDAGGRYLHDGVPSGRCRRRGGWRPAPPASDGLRHSDGEAPQHAADADDGDRCPEAAEPQVLAEQDHAEHSTRPRGRRR